MSQHTQALAAVLADLRYEQVPADVLARTADLLLDWLGPAVPGTGPHARLLFARGAEKTGPAAGRARLLVSGRSRAAYFAALANGASSHLVQQDDLPNSSVRHPATVVFPAALAAA